MKHTRLIGVIIGIVSGSGIGCTPKVNGKHFEPAYIAAQELVAGVDSIANAPLPPWTPGLGAASEAPGDYDRFRALLDRFAAQAAVCADRARTQEEKRIAQEYGDVLGAYRDSLSLWQQKRSAQSYLTGQILYAIDGKPLRDSGLETLVRKYSLETEPLAGAAGFDVIKTTAIQKLWRQAADKVRAGNRIYVENAR